MQRVGFVLKVKADKVDEYRRRHKEVWPDMLQALRETGWRNYSLFLRDDGTLFGYVEADDFSQAVADMGKREVNARWQAQMSEFFENIGGGAADANMRPLEEVFHLD